MTDNEKPLTDEELLYKEFAKGVESVMRIRCRHHINVKQHNCSEINKGECGACAFEQGIEEGRRREREEQDKRWIDRAWELYKDAAEREEAAARELLEFIRSEYPDAGSHLPTVNSNIISRWKRRKSQGGVGV